MSKIDLGKKLSDMVSIGITQADEPHYPQLVIESDNKSIAEMPDAGEATIKYRVISRTHRESKNGKGAKEYSCTLHLEVLSIDPPGGKSKKKNGDSDGGARKAFSDYFKDK